MSVVQARRWTRVEYDRMVDAGILTDNDRVELIDGEILTVTPQNSLHATGVRLVETALRAVFGRGFDIRSQLPLALDGLSEPEPDILSSGETRGPIAISIRSTPSSSSKWPIRR